MNTRRELGDGAWVEFKANGYPFKLRRQLQEADTDEKLLDLIAPYVKACAFPMADVSMHILFNSAADLNDVDEQYTSRLIWEFYDFRRERTREPITKNT